MSYCFARQVGRSASRVAPPTDRGHQDPASSRGSMRQAPPTTNGPVRPLGSSCRRLSTSTLRTDRREECS
eukprot:3755018-Pyramimonas_sp.AAC.1